jgi:hypothetical protein
LTFSDFASDCTETIFVHEEAKGFLFGFAEGLLEGRHDVCAT